MHITCQEFRKYKLTKFTIIAI
uniref:Uncharacterized protein n=1 Tax=Rhizophora mucronata TaxID=61149 RepID=A0A2P2PFF6_RHIMU